MATILLAINPEHVENIFKGIKKFEFRKKRCREEVDKIIIYSTAPVKMVVGEAEVEVTLEFELEKLWEMTACGAGVEERFFYKYYDGCEKGVAYKLKNITQYKEQKELQEYGIKRAPQSFVYVK